MAIQTYRRPLVVPTCPVSINSAPSWATTTATMDAASEKVGMIVTVPVGGTLDAIGWGTRTVAVTSGPLNWDVRVETVTTGAPSGTLLDTTTNGAQAVADTDDNKWFETTMTSAATVTAGQQIAVVIAAPGAGTFNVQAALTAEENPFHSYTLLYTGTWAKNTFTGPCLALKISGVWYPVQGSLPFANNGTAAIGTGSTPDVVGQRFQLPFPARVCGCWIVSDFDASAIIKLVSTDYHQANDTATLKAVSRTQTSDERASTTPGIHWFYFTTTPTLQANTNYRLIIEPTTAGTPNVYYWTADFLSQLDSWAGPNAHYTSAKDPTADASWTNFNNGTDGYRQLFAGLLLDGFSDNFGPRARSLIGL